MTKEQVELLRTAGISEAAIIDRLLQEQTAAPEPAPAPEPEPAPAPEPEAPKAEQPDAQSGKLDAILQAVNNLTGAIQLQNQHTGREASSQSVDDILASVLTPKPKTK